MAKKTEKTEKAEKIVGKTVGKAAGKAGKTAGKAVGTASKAKKAAGKSATEEVGGNYTDPALRERVKAKVVAGDKGGKPGQWSARKAQMVAHEYEAEGGGYRHARNAAQKSLKKWGDEKWHTADGKQAIREDGKGGEETHRYLPDAAWEELTPEQKKATDEKKVKGSKKGKQFVANTPAAKKARKDAVRKK